MKKANKSKEAAKKLGVDPEEVDFTIEEEELEDVVGGACPQICSTVGYDDDNCSQTGIVPAGA